MFKVGPVRTIFALLELKVFCQSWFYTEHFAVCGYIAFVTILLRIIGKTDVIYCKDMVQWLITPYVCISLPLTSNHYYLTCKGHEHEHDVEFCVYEVTAFKKMVLWFYRCFTLYKALYIRNSVNEWLCILKTLYLLCMYELFIIVQNVPFV